jgi:hypothetical protein
MRNTVGLYSSQAASRGLTCSFAAAAMDSGLPFNLHVRLIDTGIL